MQCDYCRDEFSDRDILHASGSTSFGITYTHIHLCVPCYKALFGNPLKIKNLDKWDIQYKEETLRGSMDRSLKQTIKIKVTKEVYLVGKLTHFKVMSFNEDSIRIKCTHKDWSALIDYDGVVISTDPKELGHLVGMNLIEGATNIKVHRSSYRDYTSVTSDVLRYIKINEGT